MPVAGDFFVLTGINPATCATMPVAAVMDRIYNLFLLCRATIPLPATAIQPSAAINLIPSRGRFAKAFGVDSSAEEMR